MKTFSGEAIAANRKKPFINQTASTFYPKRIVNQRSRHILRGAGKSLCFVPTFPSHFRCTLYFISHFPLLAVDQVVGTFTCLLKIRQGAPDGLSPVLERKKCVIISWRLAGKSISFNIIIYMHHPFYQGSSHVNSAVNPTAIVRVRVRTGTSAHTHAF